MRVDAMAVQDHPWTDGAVHATWLDVDREVDSLLLRRGWGRRRRRLADTGSVALAECLRVGPVLVVRLAVLDKEHKEDDPAHNWDEPDQQPPA